MSKLVIKGAYVITPAEERWSDIWIDDERVGGLGKLANADGYEVIDGHGCYVTPGLIDLQVNGAPECDFWAPVQSDGLKKFSENLMRAGVTSILPTLITGDMELLVARREALKSLGAGSLQCRDGYVRMPGIHFEGPCLSAKRPGVHPPQCIQPLELSVLEKLIDDSVKLITLAPENDPQGTTLKFLKDKGVTISLGHSNANLAEARRSFDQGVTMMTHTFNALPGIHHRDPGAITAALLDPRIVCCMILDGLHIDPAAAELILKCKTPASTVMVTDVAAIGTSEGSLVGSSILMVDAVRNAVRWGIASFAEAIRMSTANPAAAIGCQGQIGSLEPGAYADLVLWDRATLDIKSVYLGGKRIF